MRSRGFNKRIDIYSLESVSNGFGGYTVSETLVSSSWAKIESVNPGQAKNLTEFGIDDPQNTISITVRKRNDLVYDAEVHSIKYRDQSYKIVSAPTNKDFEDRYIRFLATKVSNSQTVAADTTPPATPEITEIT